MLCLSGERRDGALGIFFAEGFVEEDEVGVAATDRGVRGLEGLEVGLYYTSARVHSTIDRVEYTERLH